MCAGNRLRACRRRARSSTSHMRRSLRSRVPGAWSFQGQHLRYPVLPATARRVTPRTPLRSCTRPPRAGDEAAGGRRRGPRARRCRRPCPGNAHAAGTTTARWDASPPPQRAGRGEWPRGERRCEDVPRGRVAGPVAEGHREASAAARMCPAAGWPGRGRGSPRGERRCEDVPGARVAARRAAAPLRPGARGWRRRWPSERAATRAPLRGSARPRTRAAEGGDVRVVGRLDAPAAAPPTR
jgi:hypothetical protein